jgi:glucose/arabinose dehydrogenase
MPDPSGPGTAPATLELQSIGRFDQPVYATAPNGDTARVFVVEKTGRIRISESGRTRKRPFLNIASRVSSGSEQGLLSLAFPPDYRRSHHLYVDFTDRRGDTRVVEYRVSRKGPDHAVRSSARLVIRIRHPQSNHNGGQLEFGPDGLLYIGMGDGGGAGDTQNNAQSLRTLLGKLLRIDPRRSGSKSYRVPADNPFVGRAGARPEIYAYGLRNPWRFSFDHGTGALAIADVGQDAWEEVDYADEGGAKGVDYGWRVMEGNHRFAPGSSAGMVPPVLERSHADGWCAIVGGFVVRDTAVPQLAGRYVYGDNCRRGLRSVVLGPGSAQDDQALGLHVAMLSSFGQDGNGHVYAISLAGKVYRIVG